MTKSEALKHLRTPVVWESLTKAEKRVWIAKDILAAIEVGTFKPGSGYGSVVTVDDPKAGPLRPQLAMAECTGCAIAAAFIGLVARANKYECNTGNIDEEDGDLYFDDEKYRPLLREVFDSIQVAMIESAYERSPGYAHHEGCDHRDVRIANAIRFGVANANEKAQWRRHLMIAIWSNVVAHGGDFCP